MRKRPIVYLALLAASGGLLAAGVAIDRVLFMGLLVFMVMMHLGGHGGHGGHGGDAAPGPGTPKGRGTNEHPTGHDPATPAPQDDPVAGR